ncbi:54S ribosomal protein L23, mitochondrial [Neolecta irregularis DAH-3]|uniref:54S ribosomal protein L23, mitochondrial n=1 Tax=Neolecta irregularis (strain DAH-3) TaxID=1198029 RepID=A0A1U7LN60_NEOID|nr:54S ribosomal protein L23, mitochondrial [Neolecta irregularis DAH-3]|eukprot:OLL23982.1 54S ribosomal protein L23, mitochondrial [Neolecta irregularis DAH-3]
MSQNVGRTALAFSRVWHHCDASNRILGRMACSIAMTLMGKHKPIFEQGNDCGDYVVVTNCANFTTTGRKQKQKMYYSHSTKPGSLKQILMSELIIKKGGGEVIRKAVSGMLPKNRLRQVRLARLKTFEDEAHPYRKNLVRWYEGLPDDIPIHPGIIRNFSSYVPLNSNIVEKYIT